MRIENLRRIKEDGIEKSVATVIFEDIDRAPADVYFYTSKEYSSSLGLNPDAFLIAGYPAAMNLGEKRINIQGKVDERLKIGIERNMETFQKWYGHKYKIVTIESDNKDFSKPRNSNLNTGLFFSGGVDSIYSLRTNRLKYDSKHPLFAKDLFIVDGFDMHRFTQSRESLQIFNRAVFHAKKITDETGANLIPVYTNLRHHFHGDGMFWPNWYHGAALAAVAQNFTSRINTILIASSFSPEMLEPWASHPLIDPNHSSTDLKVIHDDLRSTIEKLQLISQWEIGFQNIRSCYQNDENHLNCCRCEKCVRIMVTLMALGVLEKSQAFPTHQISSNLLTSALMEHRVERHFKGSYLRLVPFLRDQGHQDIANIILRENRLKSKLRRFDQYYFQGKLKKLINSLR